MRGSYLHLLTFRHVLHILYQGKYPLERKIFLQKYFAAANTAKGFVGWFHDIFNPELFGRVYIIKGGSGTGKSTLMKKIADRAVSLGHDCEYFYCSSDPHSLDGVAVYKNDGDSFAVIDGTAPHTTDPKFPGAADEIVNLGEYWCADILKAERDEITAFSKKKARFFSEAYEDFAAAGVLFENLTQNARQMLLVDKLCGAVTRLFAKRMRECRIKGGEGVHRIRGLSALSCLGEVNFDSFSDTKITFLAVDSLGSTPFLFEALKNAADRLGLSYDTAPMALCPEFTEAIRFPELSMSVVSRTDKRDVIPINMSRFIDKEKAAECDRTRLRTIRKSVSELKSAGLAKLALAKKAHDSLEKIYIGAMDFTRLEAASEHLIERIFL